MTELVTLALLCEVSLSAIAYGLTRCCALPLKETPVIVYSFDARQSPEEDPMLSVYEAREDFEAEDARWLEQTNQLAQRGPMYDDLDLRTHYFAEPGACRRDYPRYREAA
jgi:hypothetical protein